MPKNSIEKYASNQPLIEEIRHLKKALQAGKYTQPPTINRFNNYPVDVNFTINNGTKYHISATLSPPGQQVLFAFAEVAFLKTQNYLAADVYPTGSNWSAAEKYNFSQEQHYNVNNDNYQVKFVVVFKNDTGSNLNGKALINYRYLTPGTS